MRLLILTILVTSSAVFAHQPDELVTLQGANDALTLRVAELLRAGLGAGFGTGLAAGFTAFFVTAFYT